MVNDKEEIARLRNKYLEIEKNRKKFKFSLAEKLKFPLNWTIFFALLGIIQQSITYKKFVFIEFFSNNYMAWFASFGNFVQTYPVSGTNEVLMMILKNWYYFFFTGGLISLLWAIIYLIFHLRKKKNDDLIP